MRQDYPLLTDRAAWAEANDLMLQFGEFAGLEAAIRADRSRILGNLVNFCHWRNIEHAIRVLSNGQAPGTIH